MRRDLDRATIEIVHGKEVRESRARADDDDVTPAETLVSENVELRAELAELQALVDRLGRDNALLKEKLFRLMRQRYGPKGDRFAEGQLELFAELFGKEKHEEPDAQALEAPDVELPEDPAPKSARRQKRQARQIDYQSLPREHRLHELPEDQRTCPLTGKQLVPVGAKTFEELEYRPAQLIVVEHERVEYGLSEEDRAERMAPNRLAPMPIRPIDQALAGPGLLARVLVAKYVDHLPLHRQGAIFGREGLNIPRLTLCEWTLRSIELLQPIVAAQKRRLLAGGVLQTDDTQVLCQENSTQGGRRWCFVWVWVGEDRREVVYDFSLGRDQDVVARWIGEEWSGYLVGDGYAGYGAVCRKRDPEHRIIQVGCWAHARRKVREAADSSPEDAVRVAGLIRQLYAIEAEGRDSNLDPEALRQLRREKSLPVLWRIRGLVRELLPRYAPKDSMADALGYIRNQWRTLRQYVKDGRLPIDNNACEQAIRPVAVGRRNWLFTGSPRGGALGAAIYSLLETCKRFEVEPFEYLRDVLVRVRVHPTDRLDDLTPARWRELRDAGQLEPLGR